MTHDVERDATQGFVGGMLSGDACFGTEGPRRYVSVENETGSGTMLFYEVFDGVLLAYCNFHMATCTSRFEAESDILCIDHCREGRIEQPLPHGTCAYIAEGDLKIDDRTCHTGEFVMPLAHYHGITVTFDLARAQASLDKVAAGLGLSVDLRALRRRFCVDGLPCIVRSSAQIEHIFSELYAVPDEVRDSYFRIKILELLMFLQVLDTDGQSDSRAYFHRSQVERVKAVRDAMVADLAGAHPIDELSRRADLPPTAFKACFKGVYGLPPHAYLKECRMGLAARLLRESTASVAAISCEVGYESPSKFAAAFKKRYGVSPSEFRSRGR